ncbi:C4-dicarboxylate TRAP transporter substrate-binding protein [Variovorax sp.]|uniref:C4-dicarboxylate TRAP transporter substrate-binding protein n=1 Tax=Variovorax sp. TaxID=1871043 RepID=UPI002D606662|nr:C4-dicarboxylate TRAP transporter substrate-binding protein [Variovorax sp.]HYP85541.1 C4-dicarboxylate TRAP transporter substrate-binding protein [Variovorax sp.]
MTPPRFLTAARAAACAACALLAVSGAQAQQTFKLTAAAGHPPVFLWVKTLDEVFIPEVDKRLAAAGGKYRIEWTKAWGGTLVKLGSESKGIADGVADLGVVSTIFEAPKFPLQNISYYTPFGTDDIALVSRTVADLQKRIPAMADAWTKNGLVYLGGMALDSYHLWAKFPVTKLEDMNGKKISAPGPSANWVKGTGAVAVAGSLNTYYEDIKSGVSDGTLVFTTGAWGAKVHEVAPYINKLNFGAMFAGGIAINKKRFDKLPPEVQKAIREAGDAWTEAYAKQQSALVDARLKEMVAAGAKIVEVSEAERKRWADALSPVAKTWAADAQSKGLPADQVLQAYMEALQKAGTRVPRDWSR